MKSACIHVLVVKRTLSTTGSDINELAAAVPISRLQAARAYLYAVSAWAEKKLKPLRPGMRLPALFISQRR